MDDITAVATWDRWLEDDSDGDGHGCDRLVCADCARYFFWKPQRNEAPPKQCDSCWQKAEAR